MPDSITFVSRWEIQAHTVYNYLSCLEYRIIAYESQAHCTHNYQQCEKDSWKMDFISRMDKQQQRFLVTTNFMKYNDTYMIDLSSSLGQDFYIVSAFICSQNIPYLHKFSFSLPGIQTEGQTKNQEMCIISQILSQVEVYEMEGGGREGRRKGCEIIKLVMHVYQPPMMNAIIMYSKHLLAKIKFKKWSLSQTPLGGQVD